MACVGCPWLLLGYAGGVVRCGAAQGCLELDTIARASFRGILGLLLIPRRTPIQSFLYLPLLFSVSFSVGLLVVWIDVIFFGP